MEDAHYVDGDLGGLGWVFGGVYDGHGGRHAAEYAAENLHRFLLKAWKESNDPEAAFVQAYEQTSMRLAFQGSGTTAVTFLLRRSELIVANAGDARALLVSSSGQARQLTYDHRVDDEQERQRIEGSGGRISGSYVMRGFRGLMPTRTIGDAYFKPVGIIARPFTATYTISQQDRFLIAACDGLFDVMSNQEVAEMAADLNDPESLAEALRREALDVRMGTDNLTMILLRLTGCS